MQHQQIYQPTSFEYTKIVSIVYAVVLVSFGIIFPIAESLKDQWLKTIYNTVFLVSNLTLSCLFLIYLLFYILRHENKYRSRSNDGSRWRKLRQLPSNIRYLFGKDRIARLSRKDQVLNHEAFDINMNEQKTELTPARNTRDYSICSNASSVGIDLGLLRKNSPAQDNSSSDKDVYISTREIKPVDEIEGIRCQRCSMILESGRESCSSENCSSRKHTDKEANKVSLEIGKSLEGDEEEEPVTYVDAESLGSIFTHHGSSMFLRLGALIFGLGNLVYYALEIQANLFYNVKCSNTLRFGWIFIWKFTFVFLQTFFLFKHATIHVTKHKPLVWFGMVHLIFTNVTLWIHTLVREITEEYHYVTLSETYHSNITEFAEALHNKCDSDLLHSATKYLMPFVLEYSLIAVGSISCFLYFGGMDESHHLRTNRHLVRVFSLAPADFARYNQTIDSPPVRPRLSENRVHFSESVTRDSEDSLNHKRATVMPLDHHHNIHENKNPLQKSHVGLFGGIVVLCLTVVTCVIFLFSNIQGHPSRGEVVFYSADIAIHSLLLGACLAVFVLTRSLAFAPKPISTDDILLLIAAFGSLTYEAVNVSALVSSLSTTEHVFPASNHSSMTTAMIRNTTSAATTNFHGGHLENEVSHGTRIDLQLASAMVGLVETAVQTLLILVSLRRYPASLDDAKNMPGRGTLAFLIVGNLSVWILRTILCKNIDTPVQTLFYGKIAWHLLMNINLPLLLFFRFHSSVCFADIWKVAYELFTRPGKPLIHNE